MDLEVSFTLGDSLVNNNNMQEDDLTNTAISSYSSCNGTHQHESSDSDPLENKFNTVLSLPLQKSTQCLEEEEEEEDDANRNVILSLTSTSTELTPHDEVNEDTKSGQYQFTSDPKSNTDDSNGNASLFENNEVAVGHVITSSDKSLGVQESSSTSKSGNMLPRNPSFQGPMITNIRIGTPVRKNTSNDQATSKTIPGEVEYTISVTNQNNLKLQMTTSPILQRVTCNTDCSCTSTPEKKLQENNIAAVASELHCPTHEIQIGNQTVRLRTKKNVNRKCNETRSCLSPTEEMRRHSAEITQLRHTLEQKIACQSSLCKSSYHGSPHEIKRPLSAFGYSSQYDSLAKENIPSDSPANIRKSLSYTSSPVHWQSHFRNTDHEEESKKLKFLLEDHQRSTDQYASNLYNEYKNSIGSRDRRISSPQQSHKGYSSKRNNRNYNPYIDQRCSTPFYDCEDNTDSQYNTPRGSPKPGFQRLSKTKKNDVDAKTIPEGPVVEEDGRVNYYPNCDAKIWIRTCDQEVTQPLSGVQTGKVPLWLSGALIRNGPGRLQVGEDKYNHLFDGSALLHRFHFNKGNVTYQNKFLKSRSYLRDTKAQRIVVNYFGTRAHPDPCRTIMQNIASKFDIEEHFTDNAQISLYPYGDGLYALTETPFIFRVDPENLDTHEKVDLTKCIAVMTHTAHPHVDKDGTVYNIGQGVGPLGPKYHICKFPNPKTDKKGKTKSPFEQAQIMGSVNARWRMSPCYMHSFGMTENYWIIIEQPLVVSVPKIFKVLLKRDALIDAMEWWEKETKIHVVRRATGSTISTQYVTETFFFLHTINAYEDKGHIILDICTYRNAEMLHCMYVEALKNASYDPTYAHMFRGRPKRWVIPLHPNKDASIGTNLVTLPDTKCQGRWLKKNVVYLTPELLTDIGCEVPRIYYEKYNGCPYKYFYAICSDVDHLPNPGTLIKVDVVNKTHIEWSEDNVYPSEPIFVPHPLAKNEDDGVVLSALLRAKGLNNQVCLLVLDAATFRERARVEFVAPGPVPKCLHGWFVHEGTLKVHTQENSRENIMSQTED